MNFRVRDTWNFNFSPWIKDDRYDFPVCKGGVNTYWNAQQMAAISEYTVHLPEGVCAVWNNIRVCWPKGTQETEKRLTRTCYCNHSWIVPSFLFDPVLLDPLLLSRAKCISPLVRAAEPVSTRMGGIFWVALGVLCIVVSQSFHQQTFEHNLTPGVNQDRGDTMWWCALCPWETWGE